MKNVTHTHTLTEAGGGVASETSSYEHSVPMPSNYGTVYHREIVVVTRDGKSFVALEGEFLNGPGIIVPVKGRNVLGRGATHAKALADAGYALEAVEA